MASATGYGLRYEYVTFRQSFANGWRQENPDNWLRDGIHGRSAGRTKVEVKLNCSFKLRDGHLEVIPNRPSSPFSDRYRPVVGYGGKTINTLRLRRPRLRQITSISRNLAQAIS